MTFKSVSFFAIVILLLSSLSLYAFRAGRLGHAYHPKFSGIILNYLPGDSVRVIFSDDGLASGVPIHEVMDFYVNPDSLGHFKFSLPNWGQISHLGLALKVHNKRSEHLGSYLVEVNDSIDITIYKEKDTLFTSFTGRGAGNYRCTDQLIQDVSSYQRDSHNLYRKSYDSSPNWLDSLVNYYNIAKMLDYDTLRKYKNNMTSEVYSLLMAERKAAFDKRIMFVVERMAFSNDVNVSNEFRSELKKKYDESYRLKIDVPKSAYLEISGILREYVIAKTKTDLSIRYVRFPTMKEVFNEIAKNYQGYVLDKMIGDLLFNFFNTVQLTYSDLDLQYCYAKGSQLVHTPVIKRSITMRSRLSKGKYVPDFSMIDTSGKIVKLSDFRNKVVVLDFWFTGCGGCALFYRHMKDSIEPSFDGNKKFIVISVNLDKSRTKWINSLYKDLYTTPEYTNLFARSSDFSCSLMRFYSVSGAPFVLLIDQNGKLITSGEGGFRESDNDLKSIINTEIKKKI